VARSAPVHRSTPTAACLLRLLLPLVVLGLRPVAATSRNGYALSFTGTGQIAGTRSVLLDPSNAAVARLRDGLTVMMWLAFNDLTPTRFMPPLMINTFADSNFLQPFGGLHGGFQFGGAGPDAVGQVANATDWHHYAETWNASTGRVVVWVDGQETSAGYFARGASADFLADEAYMLLGMHCYPDLLLSAAYTNCNGDFQFDGRLDDAMIFAEVLDGEAVAAAMSSEPSAARPSPVFAYDFNAAVGEGGGVAEVECMRVLRVACDTTCVTSTWTVDMGMWHVACAGRAQPRPRRFGLRPAAREDREARRRASRSLKVKANSQSELSKRTLSVGSAALGEGFAWRRVSPLPFAPPSFLIGGGKGKRGWDAPSAPWVVAAAAGEAVSLPGGEVAVTPDPFNSTLVLSSTLSGEALEVHIVPLSAPRLMPGQFSAHEGDEDRPLMLQLWGTSEVAPGIELRPTITRLPSQGGLLYQADTASASDYLAQPIGAAGVTWSPRSAATWCTSHRQTRTERTSRTSSTPSLTPRRMPAAPPPPAPSPFRWREITISPSPRRSSCSCSRTRIRTACSSRSPPLTPTPSSGTPLDLSILSLPEMGALFQTHNGTLEGVRTPIYAPFSQWYLATPTPQFVSAVTVLILRLALRVAMLVSAVAMLIFAVAGTPMC